MGSKLHISKYIYIYVCLHVTGVHTCVYMYVYVFTFTFKTRSFPQQEGPQGARFQGGITEAASFQRSSKESSAAKLKRGHAQPLKIRSFPSKEKAYRLPGLQATSKSPRHILSKATTKSPSRC